jgi:hypothetical protein
MKASFATELCGLGLRVVTLFKVVSAVMPSFDTELFGVEFWVYRW